ncbi:1-acyl-sn-glycerol-3-phosphate acyltransferase alpha isoform X1 [Eublepharis macularius]|uniref:1-acyl-sn-glycerol-3-phosphate acyltransferase n=1 Tax=Eublepharis macularius TaxID=481883 RepID=A0AA97JC50_EUBMA|nr:1-acyl-sn-glycerol-3-phosphate acyltransferase alpha isoform X1 [Eublepharis macularius]XP_054834961.1 1-acyl-sn-glycerol-3-phosphate acyltransferase alpha isoform X1 [Eublepharis macularius]
MEISLGQWLLILFLVVVPLLYEWSATFKYFCKMGFYNGYILCLAVLVIPVCALRGRNVENMKIIRSMMLHVKYLYGIKIDVRGIENFNIKEPYVVVSNHQSSLDLLGLMEVLPDRCVPIAKKELMYMGTVGLACWLGGIIFINRKKTDDAISVMSEAAQTMQREDVRVWVFPEGTRNHSGSMLPFKRGAFHLAVQAQVPIIPVVISSYRDFYSKKEKRFTTGTWYSPSLHSLFCCCELFHLGFLDSTAPIPISGGRTLSWTGLPAPYRLNHPLNSSGGKQRGIDPRRVGGKEEASVSPSEREMD